MSQRILVAYASRAGSTAEVADVVGQVLRESGAEVEVRPVEDVHSLAGYDALVLGSAIWVGKPLPEALQFATAQQQALAGLSVAYFILCDTLREDTPANRATARGYVTPLERIKQPVTLGLFAGKKDFSTVHPLLRWLLKHVVKLPEGDWRDWERIRAWAAALAPRLARAEPLPAATG
jgi:menaquinone-dependent protoporphyrinogen oxidase